MDKFLTSHASGATSDANSATDGHILEWTVHLFAARPGQVWLVIATASLAAVVGKLALQHWMGAVLGVLFIAMAAAEYLFPIRYRLSSSGVSCTYGLAHLVMQWSDVRRVEYDNGGVRLSPFRKPTRLDAFRGLYLRYAADGNGPAPEQIRECVEKLTGSQRGDR